ncbi:small nuclear ribonucleoprotein [Nitzschia inconspicua]|uniref:Small nuclear ribonucleoprotein E n=1 Tax=Nitzschia inconspicua TaxID=303405 RepID=A0A9K3PJU8_9STRA|nr:small nuclear ribonucleoprotein [Nitzschia inconspicua]KAG7374359.1 small nuclear ribonucleoprotein [Nitzschia inconspicua]
MPPKRVKKVMTIPINVIFGHLQKKTRVRVWLYEDTKMQLEGQIIGFDEYMNMVLDDAVEIGKKGRSEVGRILLKGDAITLIQEAQPEKKAAE